LRKPFGVAIVFYSADALESCNAEGGYIAELISDERLHCAAIRVRAGDPRENPVAPAFVFLPFRKRRERWGTHCVGGAGEIKSHTAGFISQGKPGCACARGSHLSQKTRKMGHPLSWWCSPRSNALASQPTF